MYPHGKHRLCNLNNSYFWVCTIIFFPDLQLKINTQISASFIMVKEEGNVISQKKTVSPGSGVHAFNPNTLSLLYF